jgi:predicted amidohydrolase YtcJ
MLVENGRVVARGPEVPSEGLAETIDHGGLKLIPGFIDNHCHILPTGLDLKRLSLESACTAQDALDLIRDRHRSHADGWLLAVHYDHNRYGRHLLRDDLDSISEQRPIMLRHASGHAGVANSAALREAGVTQGTPDPAGGAFGRDAGGQLTGLLLEQALESIYSAIPPASISFAVDAVLEAGRSMASMGIAVASDMQTGRFNLLDELKVYRTASEQGCPIAMRLYLEWDKVFGPNAADPARIEEAFAGHPPERCRVAGIKLFADGAIGASTAAVYGGYADQPLGPGEYGGTLIYPPEELTAKILEAGAAGWQVSVHSIGDHSTDLVLDAFAKTENPSRHRLEHAMILSDRQIERLADIGCHVTFQPEFLMRFGNTYRKQLGPERAAKLLRTRSLLDAGIKLSFSSDRPITGGDPWDGIKSATQRPEGFDQSENCTLKEAFEAYTKAAAAANEDSGLMGALSPGTLADFQLLPRGMGSCTT